MVAELVCGRGLLQPVGIGRKAHFFNLIHILHSIWADFKPRGMTEKAEPAVYDEKHPREAWINHVVPFVAWLFFMQMLGEAAGWKYALRSVICLGLFLYLKPWQWYTRLM